jgi:hypothetical protein
MKYVVLLAALAACTDSSAPPPELGASCPPACPSGLTCIQRTQEMSGPGCVSLGGVCSVACGSDADCMQALGAAYHCMGSCFGPGYCR